MTTHNNLSKKEKEYTRNRENLTGLEDREYELTETINKLEAKKLETKKKSEIADLDSRIQSLSIDIEDTKFDLPNAKVKVAKTEVIYNKIPLQAIDGKFYSQDGATLKQIKATFKTLIEERKSAAEENEDIQSILDNISYVIETYGESNKLIIELNKIRETFPDKSSATEIGRMYTTFKDSFFGVNEKAIRGNPLFERLIKSSKIIEKLSVIKQPSFVVISTV